jgi:hypothetical protein
MAGARRAVERVYVSETPEALARAGVEVVLGAARFEDPHTLAVGSQTRLRARHVLVCTGARPSTAGIPGLESTPHWTYTTVRQQDRLPRRLLILVRKRCGGRFLTLLSRPGSGSVAASAVWLTDPLTFGRPRHLAA